MLIEEIIHQIRPKCVQAEGNTSKPGRWHCPNTLMAYKISHCSHALLKDAVRLLRE